MKSLNPAVSALHSVTHTCKAGEIRDALVCDCKLGQPQSVSGRLVYHVLIDAVLNRTCELVLEELQRAQVDKLSNLSRNTSCTQLNHHATESVARKG